jgi:magnesium-protoporphyrin O-methyltransferase
MVDCCPHCQGADRFFDDAQARADLEGYRRDGVGGSTKRLIKLLKSLGVTGLSVLDIGGGIGAIQHELIAAGATSTVDVDASRAYLALAKEEAQRRGYADKAQYHFGDFVALAQDIGAADIVTLDRAICCYPDVRALVAASAGKTRRYLGLVYPRDVWWTRFIIQPAFNLYFRLRRNPFRFFVHSSHIVDSIAAANGLQKHVHQHKGFWQVVVYVR